MKRRRSPGKLKQRSPRPAMKPQPIPPPKGETILQIAIAIALYIIGFLAALVFIPLFLPISLIFRIYRHMLHAKIMISTRGDAQIASADDSVWFQDSPQNLAMINSIMFLQGEFDLEWFQEQILERMVHARDEDGKDIGDKFTRYPTKILHRYVWMKDESFDIKNHVYEWEGELPRTQEEIERLVGELCSQIPPGRRPPWMMIVIPCYKRETPLDIDDAIPVIYRVHHGIGDGVSLMTLLMTSLLDVKPETKKGLPQRFASKGVIMRLTKAIFTGPTMILGRIFWPADTHALHGPTLSGDKLFTWSHNFDLNLVKRMKNVTATTVNDILMSCLAGGFHEYFKKYASAIPQDLLTYVPVDIRSNKSKLRLDNQFALVFMKLPINISDRLQRLSETQARMLRIKNSAEPVVNALIIRYLMARFPNWLTQRLFDNIASKCSLVLSNVPGPQYQCSLSGLTMQQMIFWPPQRVNVGMGISILSYNGTVKMGLMIDKRLCSNPRRLLIEFEKEIYNMAKQLGVLRGVS